MSQDFSPARDEDFAFIAAAQRETAATSYGRPWSAEKQAELLQRVARSSGEPSSRLTVLRQDGATVGYFWLEMRKSEVAFLLDIYVLPAQWRQHLGASMLDEATREAGLMGATELRLAVAARNERALGFFTARGFEIGDREVRENAVWFELVKRLA